MWGVQQKDVDSLRVESHTLQEELLDAIPHLGTRLSFTPDCCAFRQQLGMVELLHPI